MGGFTGGSAFAMARDIAEGYILVRITSYNVCYTKLLRASRRRSTVNADSRNAAAGAETSLESSRLTATATMAVAVIAA